MAIYKGKMKKGYGEGFVSGHDEMVGRDSYAGLPDEKVMKEYPKSPMHNGYYQDDSISGIDMANRESTAKSSSYMSKQK